jgi:predicted dienelactone hydrolase
MQGMVERMATRLLVVLALLVPALAAGGPDPSAPGRFAVGTMTLTVTDTARARTLVTEVWYPATAAGRDTPPARGRHPLVLVAHGSCGFRTNYEYVTEPLASFGFIVAAPDFPGMTRADCVNGFPQGMFFDDPALDLSFLRGAFPSAAGPLASHVRGRRAGLLGSSLGGFAVLKASVADPHFTTVVALAAFAGTASGEPFATLRPRRAVLSFAGTADRTLPPANFAVPFFAELPAPSFLVTIAGGTHGGFSDMDSSLSPEALARQHAVVRRYAIAFLARYLDRDRRFTGVLTSRDAAVQGPDVAFESHRR